MQISYVDGPRFRRALLAACEYAQQQRGILNRINVFPVPDGDTGTNLALTLQAISDQIRGNRDRSISVVANHAAQAAVLGARGNCGMMLSHFLLGFATKVKGENRIDANDFGGAMAAGVENLYEALEQPVEGTILTVMRDTADAATGAPTRDFAPLLEQLLAKARESLDHTPELLPILKSAGVVDAGAKGFVSLLEGIVLFLNGDPIVAPMELDFTDSLPAVANVGLPEQTERYRFCTEALVRGDDLPDQNDVRDSLRGRGDSLIVIRTGDILKIHVHTDDPEEVFAYLRTLGRLATHKAEDMKAQYAAVGAAASKHVSLARRPVGVVTDSAADLPEEVVRAHGIQVVPLMLVTKDDVLRDGVDITASQFHEWLREDRVLPTTSQPTPAAFKDGFERCAQDSERVVSVVLASGLSGTFQSAEAAAGLLDDVPVDLMDSQGVSLLQGLVVLKAAELAESGMDPTEIVAELERVRDQSGLLFTLDTFDRLVASGRVSRSRAWLGTVLKVKPILEVTREGKLVVAGKALGRERVLRTIMDFLAERVPAEAERVRFGIIHVGCPEMLEIVDREIRGVWPDCEILTAPATPVVSTHLGLGAWGVAFMVED
ncbi:MAG: DegV family protein [Gemmatimonadota bacterium]|nr:MAG: DegV family protein [Gemmatimonadota bacterium]